MDTFLNGTAFEDEDSFWLEVQTKIVRVKKSGSFVTHGFSAPLVRTHRIPQRAARDPRRYSGQVVPHSGVSRRSSPTCRRCAGSTPQPCRYQRVRTDRRTQDEFDEMLGANHGQDALKAVHEVVNAAAEFGGYPSIGKDAATQAVHQLQDQRRSAGSTGRSPSTRVPAKWRFSCAGWRTTLRPSRTKTVDRKSSAE